MIIQCPNCAARFKFNETKISSKGSKVRCTHCKNIFNISPPTKAGGAPSVSSAQPTPRRMTGAFEPLSEPPNDSSNDESSTDIKIDPFVSPDPFKSPTRKVPPKPATPQYSPMPPMSKEKPAIEPPMARKSIDSSTPMELDFDELMRNVKQTGEHEALSPEEPAADFIATREESFEFLAQSSSDSQPMDTPDEPEESGDALEIEGNQMDYSSYQQGGGGDSFAGGSGLSASASPFASGGSEKSSSPFGGGGGGNPYDMPGDMADRAVDISGSAPVQNDQMEMGGGSSSLALDEEKVRKRHGTTFHHKDLTGKRQEGTEKQQDYPKMITNSVKAVFAVLAIWMVLMAATMFKQGDEFDIDMLTLGGMISAWTGVSSAADDL